ncbi:hypothetical protein CYLTODRAFT_486079 [Cylindrobasidium torrendii FP15055 ss-10]|uniref:DUF6697 domain-containing protein n=1 Tax=Cylindrobasidium torrendii FP15055 ss-10 TaxID=1314674 RepID=A0A0D7BTB9_9AGAR|nr:hypothetical protein CYLTODRAFT_486079 [Cylindrobasidium torrendii FP15055 ss-10]
MASAPSSVVLQDAGHDRLQIPTLLRHLADAYEKIEFLEAAQTERHNQARAIAAAKYVLHGPAVQSGSQGETSSQQLSPTEMESAFVKAREEYHKQETELQAARARIATMESTIAELQRESTRLSAYEQAAREHHRLRQDAEIRITALAQELDAARNALSHERERRNHLEKENEFLRNVNVHAEENLEAAKLQVQLDEERRIQAELRRELEVFQTNAKNSLNAVKTTLHKRTSSQSTLGARRSLTLLQDKLGMPPPPVPDVKVIIPEHRLADFKALPPVVPDALESDLKVTLDRDFLRIHVGGSIQPLVVNIQHRKDIGLRCNIGRFLCVNRDQNAWCPSEPGQHGYAFVGLGTERHTFLQEEEWPLFIGLPKEGSGRLKVMYMGRYKVVRVPGLSVEEWKDMPSTFKRRYVQTTIERDNTHSLSKKKETVEAMYDSGELFVPCIRLQCVGFDEVFHKLLVTTWKAERELHSANTDQSISAPGSSSHKRRRSMPNEEEGQARRRRTLTMPQ